METRRETDRETEKGILLPKLFWPTVSALVIEKNFLKFEAEGREFGNFLISLEQFIQAVKGKTDFW